MKTNPKPNANIVGADPTRGHVSSVAHKFAQLTDVSARDHRGITLVALIITIIVMLILVGVSITIAINGGLFDTTKKAAKETEKAKNAEQDLASGRIKIDGIWYDSLEDYAIGKASAVQSIVDLDESNTKFKYTPEGWTNGEVRVGIDASSVSSGFILKYSTDDTNWNDYTAEIPMRANGSIYAKLVDRDGKEGGAITANVSNIDTQAPVVNTHIAKNGEETDTTIPLSINVTDSVSGISKIIWYYKLEAETNYTPKEEIYKTMNGKEAGEKIAVTKETTLTELKPLSTYNIYAVVYDVAGNSTRSPESGTIDITTKKAVVKPQIGDYVNYEPDIVTDKYELLGKYNGYGDQTALSQEKLNWQILKIHEDGSINLIGTPTTGAVYFKGALGYNNGVYLLNDICNKLYSKPSQGIEARSVNLEDFEDESNGGKWKEVRGDFAFNGLNYGHPITYQGGAYCYPNLYAKEDGSGIDTEEIKANGIKASDRGSLTEEACSYTENKLTVTETYYDILINEENYGKTASVLGVTPYYHVATRYTVASSAGTCWGIYNTCTGCTNSLLLGFNSIDYSCGCSLRPVVTLKSSARLELSEDDLNSNVNTFNITKY